MARESQAKEDADRKQNPVSKAHDEKNTKSDHKKDDDHDWKSVVTKRKTDVPEYPTVSMFQKNDKVWVERPDERDVTGPCEIIDVLGNERYKLKDDGTGEIWEESGEFLRYRL